MTVEGVLAWGPRPRHNARGATSPHPLALWCKLHACHPHPASFNSAWCGGFAPHERL